MEEVEILGKIAAHEAHISWCKDQIDVLGNVFWIFLAVTVIVLAVAIVLAVMRRGKGHDSGIRYGFSVLILIFMIVAVALTFVATQWQYPGEIAAAERSIEALQELLESL